MKTGRWKNDCCILMRIFIFLTFGLLFGLTDHMKFIISTILICTWALNLSAQEYFEHFRKKDKNNLSFYFTAGLNSNKPFLKKLYGNQWNRSSITLMTEAGGQYHRDISRHSFLRFGLGLGLARFGGRYAPKYQSTTDTLYPLTGTDRTSMSVNIATLNFHASYGRYFLIGKQHLIDASIGISVPFNINRAYETSDSIPFKVTGKRYGTLNFVSYTETNFGNSKKFMNGNVMAYIGYRKIGTLNPYLEKISVGLLGVYSVYANDAGYIKINYYNTDYHTMHGEEKVVFGYAYLGARVSYDLF